MTRTGNKPPHLEPARFTLFLRSLDGSRGASTPTAREEALVLTAHVRADAEREAREIIARRVRAGERVFNWQLVERPSVLWRGGEA